MTVAAVVAGAGAGGGGGGGGGDAKAGSALLIETDAISSMLPSAIDDRKLGLLVARCLEPEEIEGRLSSPKLLSLPVSSSLSGPVSSLTTPSSPFATPPSNTLDGAGGAWPTARVLNP